MHDATDIRAQLEQERRLIEGATEGPWAYEPESVGPNGEWYRPARAYVEIESHGPDGVEGDELTLGGGSPEDAAFIAHARTALPVRNAQIEAVLALHKPLEIYYGDNAEEVIIRSDSEDPAHIVCQECTDAYVVELIGDCEWNEDHETTPYPCPTVRAIEEAGK